MCSSEQRRNQRASKAWKNVNETYKVATSERFGGSETTEPTGGLWNRWAVCVGSPDSRRLLEFEAPRVVLVVFFCLSPSFYICISLSFSLSLLVHQVHGTRAFYLRDEFASVPPVSPSAPFVPSAHGFSVLPAAPHRTRTHRKTQAHDQTTHARACPATLLVYNPILMVRWKSSCLLVVCRLPLVCPQQIQYWFFFSS